MNNDYIIAVNENGEPFIAHALKKHKSHHITNYAYFRKVKLPNGKTRYFYTEKAYQIWLENQDSTKKEERDKQKRARIRTLQKTYISVVKKLGPNSKEAQGLLKKIEALKDD